MTATNRDSSPNDAEDVPVLGACLDRLRSLTCAKWTRFAPGVLPAWVADMDLAPAPACVDAVRAMVERGDFGYNFAAECRLAEAFAAWEERRHGWRPEQDELRLFCDVMQAVEAALWLHTEPGDGVVVFTPIYPPFLGSVERNGRRIVECPLDPDGWRIDPERLAAAIDPGTRAILLCNPHNPTGRVLDRGELAAIADVAVRNDLLVISDEIWGDLTHPGATHTPLALLGEEIAARTVTISAASKAFNLAGLRCAIAHIGHPAVRSRVQALPSHLLGAVGSLSAEASLAAWTAGEPWLAATTRHLTARRDQLAARLAADLPEVGFSLPEATYLAWLDFRPLDLGPDPAEFLLEHARVALGRGLDFGASGAGFARINFATSATILDAIVDRIVAVVRKER